MRVGVALSVALVASIAHAQNPKATCADASERGQRLLDERRMLEARHAFLSCAQDSCPTAVKHDCQSQLDDLKKNLPSIVIRVKDKDGSDVARGTVSLDGAQIGVLDGQVLEADPGTHKIHVELPDGRAFDRQIILAAGEKSRPVTFDASSTEKVPDVSFEHHATATHWSTVKTVGLVALIVGGTTLVAGAVAMAIAQIDQDNAITRRNSSANCPTLSLVPPDVPTNYDLPCQDAISYHQQGLSAQSAAFALLIGGGVVTVTGVVMFLVGGNKSAATSLHVTPLLSPSFAGLSFGAAF